MKKLASNWSWQLKGYSEVSLKTNWKYLQEMKDPFVCKVKTFLSITHSITHPHRAEWFLLLNCFAQNFTDEWHMQISQSTDMKQKRLHLITQILFLNSKLRLNYKKWNLF